MAEQRENNGDSDASSMAAAARHSAGENVLTGDLIMARLGVYDLASTKEVRGD